ncbi:Erythroid transcription factor [Mortierella claussenii]|nr:Erythroid transcription factor [Mortierella claussenii]
MTMHEALLSEDQTRPIISLGFEPCPDLNPEADDVDFSPSQGLHYAYRASSSLSSSPPPSASATAVNSIQQNVFRPQDEGPNHFSQDNLSQSLPVWHRHLDNLQSTTVLGASPDATTPISLIPPRSPSKVEAIDLQHHFPVRRSCFMEEASGPVSNKHFRPSSPFRSKFPPQRDSGSSPSPLDLERNAPTAAGLIFERFEKPLAGVTSSRSDSDQPGARLEQRQHHEDENEEKEEKGENEEDARQYQQKQQQQQEQALGGSTAWRVTAAATSASWLTSGIELLIGAEDPFKTSAHYPSYQQQSSTYPPFTQQHSSSPSSSSRYPAPAQFSGSLSPVWLPRFRNMAMQHPHTDPSHCNHAGLELQGHPAVAGPVSSSSSSSSSSSLPYTSLPAYSTQQYLQYMDMFGAISGTPLPSDPAGLSSAHAAGRSLLLAQSTALTDIDGGSSAEGDRRFFDSFQASTRHGIFGPDGNDSTYRNHITEIATVGLSNTDSSCTAASYAGQPLAPLPSSSNASSGSAVVGYNSRSEIQALDPDPKHCDNCRTTTTPSWRRCPQGRILLCNACGLYQKLHNVARPVYVTKEGVIKIRRNAAAVEHPPCSSCGTTVAAAWKKGANKEPLCNVCSASIKQCQQGLRPQEPQLMLEDATSSGSEHIAPSLSTTREWSGETAHPSITENNSSSSQSIQPARSKGRSKASSAGSRRDNSAGGGTTGRSSGARNRAQNASQGSIMAPYYSTAWCDGAAVDSEPPLSGAVHGCSARSAALPPTFGVSSKGWHGDSSPGYGLTHNPNSGTTPQTSQYLPSASNMNKSLSPLFQQYTVQPSVQSDSTNGSTEYQLGPVQSSLFDPASPHQLLQQKHHSRLSQPLAYQPYHPYQSLAQHQQPQQPHQAYHSYSQQRLHSSDHCREEMRQQLVRQQYNQMHYQQHQQHQQQHQQSSQPPQSQLYQRHYQQGLYHGESPPQNISKSFATHQYQLHSTAAQPQSYPRQHQQQDPQDTALEFFVEMDDDPAADAAPQPSRAETVDDSTTDMTYGGSGSSMNVSDRLYASPAVSGVSAAHLPGINTSAAFTAEADLGSVVELTPSPVSLIDDTPALASTLSGTAMEALTFPAVRTATTSPHEQETEARAQDRSPESDLASRNETQEPVQQKTRDSTQDSGSQMDRDEQTFLEAPSQSQRSQTTPSSHMDAFEEVAVCAVKTEMDNGCHDQHTSAALEGEEAEVLPSPSSTSQMHFPRRSERQRHGKATTITATRCFH